MVNDNNPQIDMIVDTPDVLLGKLTVFCSALSKLAESILTPTPNTVLDHPEYAHAKKQLKKEIVILKKQIDQLNYQITKINKC
ncbi:hypothetical protein [Sporosarcina sp. FSL W7-1283]|uniref:hypothetical protein n=1 Tax=Sporosarcina sp. FSL W7-1283 TaxID=2921560 RepID=UPI0030FC3DD5